MNGITLAVHIERDTECSYYKILKKIKFRILQIRISKNSYENVFNQC